MSTVLVPDPGTTPPPVRPRDVVYMCPCGNLLPVPSTISVVATGGGTPVYCTLHEPPIPMRRYILTEG